MQIPQQKQLYLNKWFENIANATINSYMSSKPLAITKARSIPGPRAMAYLIAVMGSDYQPER